MEGIDDDVKLILDLYFFIFWIFRSFYIIDLLIILDTVAVVGT